MLFFLNRVWCDKDEVEAIPGKRKVMGSVEEHQDSYSEWD